MKKKFFKQKFAQKFIFIAIVFFLASTILCFIFCSSFGIRQLQLILFQPNYFNIINQQQQNSCYVIKEHGNFCVLYNFTIAENLKWFKSFAFLTLI